MHTNVPYTNFIFEDYSFDSTSATATFQYSFDDKLHFEEQVVFSAINQDVDKMALEGALRLAFYLAATSYYKAFPTKGVIFKKAPPNKQQAEFLQAIYTKGLSQFIFENQLSLDQLAAFEASGAAPQPVQYKGEGVLALQSGGKDSLLMTTILNENSQAYSAMYVSSTGTYPKVLNDLGVPIRTVKRILDKKGLEHAAELGGLNGHVPVTYIVSAYALIDAILHNENKVLLSIGTEGEEPHEFVGKLPVNHQWSKTWEAENLLVDYVHTQISPTIDIGSPLRGFTELKIAELFVQRCWQTFGNTFSSCNIANYKQGENNDTLTWCGECPKCANSYLLFAPFVEPRALQSLFGGQDLFKKELLTETFKGLLGIDGVMKPFECVGETDELRQAYHMARKKNPGYSLPFEVPDSSFDYQTLRASQAWAYELVR